VNNIRPVTFTGIKNFIPKNPANKFACNFFNRSAELSRRRFIQIEDSFQGKDLFIHLKHNKHMHAFDINPKNSEQYVTFFHGASHNITQPEYQSLYGVIGKRNYGVFAPEYSGFGRNKPQFIDENSIISDVKASAEYLFKTKNIKPENTVVVGYSMGSFAAAEFARANQKVKALILVSPIESLSSEARQMFLNKKIKNVPYILKVLIKRFPFLLKPLDNTFRVDKKIKQVKKVPVQIIHALQDQKIKISSARKLAESIKNPAGPIIELQGGHAMNSDKINAISAILKKLQPQL
jgi:pimeloyl-ACP methyl ester carboxylesterase